MNVIERNNVNIRGRGGRPMIFAHGYGCDQTIWQLVAPSFEKEYETILFDHVGAGRSDTSHYDRTKYNTLHGYADDLVEIGQRLEISEAIFVGHSVSAMIGLLAAIKNPKLFERLILIGPSPCYFNENSYCGGFSFEDLNAMLQDMESNFESWAVTMAPVIMGNPQRPELAEELVEKFCRNKPEIARHFAHVTFLSDHRRDLSQVQVPSVLLQCSQDQIAPESVGRYMQATLPFSRLHIMEATGHCPHLSAPKETTATIHRYASDPPKIV